MHLRVSAVSRNKAFIFFHPGKTALSFPKVSFAGRLEAQEQGFCLCVYLSAAEVCGTNTRRDIGKKEEEIQKQSFSSPI